MSTYTSLHYNTIDAKINSFDNNVLKDNAQWRLSSSSVGNSSKHCFVISIWCMQILITLPYTPVIDCQHFCLAFTSSDFVIGDAINLKRPLPVHALPCLSITCTYLPCNHRVFAFVVVDNSFYHLEDKSVHTVTHEIPTTLWFVIQDHRNPWSPSLLDQHIFNAQWRLLVSLPATTMLEKNIWAPIQDQRSHKSHVEQATHRWLEHPFHASHSALRPLPVLCLHKYLPTA